MKKKTVNSVVYILSVSCLLIFSVISFNSCIGAENPPSEDTPTQGKITISIDESLQPVIDAQVKTFEGIYYQAKIKAQYKSEVECMTDLLNDSARCVVVTRELLPAEKKIFKDWEITPRITKIAYDAIAIVTNKANKDTLLKENNIIDLLAGKIGRWNQLVPKSGNSSDVTVVFDNKNGGITRYFLERMPGNKIGNKKVYAVNSSKDVVDYVSKNKDAIGFINMAWVSDIDDSITDDFLSNINVAEVAPSDTSQFKGFYYKPYLANLALKMYPFMRSIYVISKEARVGLATGFTRFMASDKGQRIVLKAGLLPATMPIRLIEVDNQNLQIGKD